MNDEIISWIGIACLGIMNLYVGRLLALGKVPSGFAGPRSWKVAVISWKVAVLFFSIGGIGSLLLYLTNGFQLTLSQAIFLSSSSLGSFIFHNRNKPHWDEYFNKYINTVLGICAKHGWKITSYDTAIEIATVEGYHFDYEDYQTLLGMWGKRAKSHSLLPPHVKPDGQIDWDRTCARDIVSLVNALLGCNGVPGMIEKVSQDYRLDALNQEALKRIQWLAEGLKKQWGLNDLYDGKE